MYNLDYAPQQRNSSQEIARAQVASQNRRRWLEDDVCREKDQDDD